MSFNYSHRLGGHFINDVIKHLIDHFFVKTCELYNLLASGEWVG
jgi:hypothetical protein